uniref:Fibrinogen C-terminal domain-containing protein n=1 Tax=Branchiostoma floridae TaxID=7739 RepID=C3YYR6_BRAFL|eukprot:XP_002598412.1 hypothetical protein BRAFLDRAFT_83187 [Branchiostoma floridae]
MSADKLPIDSDGYFSRRRGHAPFALASLVQLLTACMSVSIIVLVIQEGGRLRERVAVQGQEIEELSALKSVVADYQKKVLDYDKEVAAMRAQREVEVTYLRERLQALEAKIQNGVPTNHQSAPGKSSVGQRAKRAVNSVTWPAGHGAGVCLQGPPGIPGRDGRDGMPGRDCPCGSKALPSCKAYVTAGRDYGDGWYTVQPDPNSEQFSVYCDQTTLGGGWMRFYYKAGPNTCHNYQGVTWTEDIMSKVNATDFLVSDDITTGNTDQSWLFSGFESSSRVCYSSPCSSKATLEAAYSINTMQAVANLGNCRTPSGSQWSQGYTGAYVSVKGTLETLGSWNSMYVGCGRSSTANVGQVTSIRFGGGPYHSGEFVHTSCNDYRVNNQNSITSRCMSAEKVPVDSDGYFSRRLGHGPVAFTSLVQLLTACMSVIIIVLVIQEGARLRERVAVQGREIEELSALKSAVADYNKEVAAMRTQREVEVTFLRERLQALEAKIQNGVPTEDQTNHQSVPGSNSGPRAKRQAVTSGTGVCLQGPPGIPGRDGRDGMPGRDCPCGSKDVTVDEFASNNGGCAQTCTNSFVCSCRDGFVLNEDGLSCDALPSCKAYITAGRDYGDGWYTVQPDPNSEQFSVYCDQTTLGGGWMRFYYKAGPNTCHNYQGVTWTEDIMSKVNATDFLVSDDITTGNTDQSWLFSGFEQWSQNYISAYVSVRGRLDTMGGWTSMYVGCDHSSTYTVGQNATIRFGGNHYHSGEFVHTGCNGYRVNYQNSITSRCVFKQL